MIVAHPTLPILCRSDGQILRQYGKFLKEGDKNWTSGSLDKRTGYKQISIKNKHHRVHVLIAEAFLGFPPNSYPEYMCDHINRIRDDNRPENLRWVTPKENSHNMAIYLESEAIGRPHKGDTDEWRTYQNANHRRTYALRREADCAKRRKRFAERMLDPEFREKRNARARTNRAKNKEV